MTSTWQAIGRIQDNNETRRNDSMPTSKPPRQPLAKASTHRTNINVGSGQTQAGSTIPAKPASIRSNNESLSVHSSPDLGQYEHNAAQSSKTPHSALSEDTEVWDKKAVLALDGGGIRGYSSLLILKRLMEVVSDLEGRQSNGEAKSSYHPLLPPPITSTLPSDRMAKEKGEGSTSSWLPYHYFDYMAGTSTGGLIAIMLGRLTMSVDDCISVYEQLGEEIFGRPRWFHVRSPLFWPRDKYNHKTLEAIIQNLVKQRIPDEDPGKRNFAFDENRCKVMVVTFKSTSDDANKPYLFRSYDNLHQIPELNLKRLDRNPGQAHQVEIWRVARATSAAPTYFKNPIIEKDEYCDGGFGTNNPCREIYNEVRCMNNQSTDCTKVVLSIGTGVDKPISRFAGKGIGRYLNYLRFATTLVTTPTLVDDAMADESVRPDGGFQYYRLSVKEGLSTVELDQWHSRGYFRLKLGRCIGRLRSKRSAHAQHDNIISATEKRQNGALIHSDDGKVDHSPEVGIPQWFRPKNRTLETIREHTEAYLNGADATTWINGCAHQLVNSRRQRAENSPCKWAKVCASMLYQCRVIGCRRGENKYSERDDLRRHLTDKHEDIYSGRVEDNEILESFLDDCKVELH